MIFPSLSSRLITLAALFLLLWMVSLPGSASEERVIPPKSITLMLQFSTLSETPTDEKTLVEWYHIDHFIKDLKLSKGTKLRLVVPVFDSGRAFYATTIPPFSGRTPNARANENSLNELLLEAKKKGIQVFLGFNLLGWQKASTQSWDPANKAEIFDSSPEMEELTKELEPASTGTHFASPWSPVVRESLSALMTESAKRFPLASGVVLDMHLSRNEIMGFGSQARLASRRSIHLDPVGLNIQGTANEELSENAQTWVQWRNHYLRDFVWSLAGEWQRARGVTDSAEVWLSGSAGFDATPGFDTLRSGQDTIAWLNDTPPSPRGSLISGALLEGHWQSGDSSRWKQFKLKVKNQTLIPIVNSSLGATPYSVAESWLTLKTQSGTEDVGILVANASSKAEAKAFLAGQSRLPQRSPLEIGTIVPPVQFYDPAKEEWGFRDVLNQKELLLVNLNSQTLPQAQRQWMQSRQILERLEQRNDPETHLLGLVSSIPNILPGRLLTVPMPPAKPLLLADPRREWLARCPEGLSLVSVDKAGFVRDIRRLKDVGSIPDAVQALSQPTPPLAVGMKAPDFIVTDMNGQVRHLADLLGERV